MKMIAEYLEHAVQFERMAAAEADTQFKKTLLEQAQAYRKLASERAASMNLPAPDPPRAS